MTVPRRDVRLRPRREPRQARAEETRARILEAAAAVFEARGYEGGTTNHIARAASMSVGSLYQYFPNKDAILVELMVEHVAEGGEQLRAAIDVWRTAESEIEGLVRRVIGDLLALHRKAPVLHEILMTRVPMPRDVSARISVLEAGFVAELAHDVKVAGDFPEDEALLRAAMAVSAVNALVHQQVARADPPVPDTVFVAETSRLIAPYLTAPPATREDP